MKKITLLFVALMTIMSMNATAYLKGSFNGWGDSNPFTNGKATITLSANATFEFKINDGSNWYGNNGTMKSDNCTDWTFNSSDGNAKITTTIAGEYVFTWNSSSKKVSVTYPTEAVKIDYYIAGTIVAAGWNEKGQKMTENNGLYTYTASNLAAGNYEFKVTNGTWNTTSGFSDLATTYQGVTAGENNNIALNLAETIDLTVTFSGSKISLNLPEKTYTIYFVDQEGWGSVNAYVWTGDPYKSWPGEAMTKIAGKTYKGKDVYEYTYPAKYSQVIFNGGGKQTGDLTISEGNFYYYDQKWNASIAYDVPEVTATWSIEEGATLTSFTEAVITFANVEKVATTTSYPACFYKVEGETVALVEWGGAAGVLTPTAEGAKITFDASNYTNLESGDYRIELKAGTIKFNGDANNLNTEAYVLNFKYEAPVVVEPTYTVSPENNSTVKELKEIVITYPELQMIGVRQPAMEEGPNQSTWPFINQTMTMEDEFTGNTSIFEQPLAPMAWEQVATNAVKIYFVNTYGFETLTNAGTYSVTIPAGLILFPDTQSNKAFTLYYTVDPTQGPATEVENVAIANVYTQNGMVVAEGEFQIFTITGQNVTDMNGNLANGVYVVRTANTACKVVVK